MKRKALYIGSLSFLLLVSSCGESMADKLQNKMGTLSEMAELGTVEYTIKKIIKASDEAFYTIGERKILFSCSATMKAGIDLGGFSAENVEINSDKEVTVTLPAPKVLAFNMPPEQIKLEYEKVGALRFDFTAEERSKLLKQGEEAILADAENLGILADAEKNAKTFFEAMLKQIGFEKVNINFNKQ